MIHFGNGDIFATDVEAYAHGCNCAGFMGAGIAVEFKKRWPRVFRSYNLNCEAELFQPGDAEVFHEDDKWIINLGTQEALRGAELRHIQCALGNMIKEAHFDGIKSIAMPAIGAGLGGLDWDDVKPLFEQLITGDIDVYIAETYEPGVSLICG